ncbi:MAG: MFS transporter, partial [Planctomycetes bacterium]|nr:MFS transporter [Planctomycetota bacterium]
IAILVNRAGTMALPLLVLWLTERRGFDTDEASNVMIAYGAFALIGSLGSGFVCDRIGVRPVMIGSLLGMAAALFVLPFVHGTAWLMLVVALWAICGEGFRPASFAAIDLLAPPQHRALSFAFARTAVNLGMSIGPLSGSFLAQWHFDAVFAVNASMAALAALLFTRVPIPRQAKPPTTNAGVDARPARDRRLVIVLIAAFFTALVFFQIDSTLPLFITRDLGLAKPWFGFVVAANTLLIVLVEIPLNHATAHWPTRRTLTLSTAFIGLGFASYAFAHGPIGLLAATAIWSVGEMLCFPTQSALVASLAPPGRSGRTMSLYVFTFGLALPVGAGLGPRVYERFGANMVWIGCLVLAGIAAWMYSRNDGVDVASAPEPRSA